MRHYEVGVMEIGVDFGLSQKESGQAAGYENRYKAEREEASR